MKTLLLLCVLCLAGCGSLPAPDPIIVTQRVEVPVPVTCAISYPKTPAKRLVLLPETATAKTKAEAAIKELEDQRWYSKELEAILGKCAKDTKSN